MPGRHVAVLADMLEMGPGEEKMHFELGRYAAENGVELLLCCGKLSRYTAEGAEDKALWFESREALAAVLPEYIKPGDTVLVKGSRGMHMEDISELLKKI